MPRPTTPATAIVVEPDPAPQASFWGNYKVQQGPVSGLELGSGVRYVGSSVGIGAVNADYTPIYGSAQVPAHTVWDAMIGYDFARTGVPRSTSTTC
jgi:iron complex outermembrane receptor protein